VIDSLILMSYQLEVEEDAVASAANIQYYSGSSSGIVVN